MPGYNRTGPTGQGPMTGRGQGACNTFSDTSFQGSGSGRGLGMRRGNRFARTGSGMGFRRRSAWNQAPAFEPYPEDTAQEISMLKAQADSVKQALDQIYNRIKILEET